MFKKNNNKNVPEKSKHTQSQLVFVLFPDVPSKPIGPLTATNLTESSATLSWQQPAYDGGSDITGYMLEVKSPLERTWTKVGGIFQCLF